MSRLGLLAVGGVCTLSFMPARAAELTDVADAVDIIHIGTIERKDAFDMYIGLRFGMDTSWGRITREPIDRASVMDDECNALRSPDCRPVDELAWGRTVNILRLSAQVGLYRDLALTLDWDQVASDVLEFRWAEDAKGNATASAETSTVEPVDPAQKLFAHDFKSRHKGSGPLRLGLRWAPFVDERDDTKATWLLAFGWEMPFTSDVADPAVEAAEGQFKPVGDGIHRLHFELAFSRRRGLPDAQEAPLRRGYFDPYLSFAYTLPVADGTLALEPHRAPLEFAATPPHVGRVRLGTEIIPYEHLQASRWVALDVGIDFAYFSEGRSYSVLSDALRELTYTDQYASFSGLFGIYVQAADFLKFKVGLSGSYVSSYWLTYETYGEDAPNKPEKRDGEVKPGDVDDKINPYFCGYTEGDLCQSQGLLSYDQIGGRFRSEGQFTFSWYAALVMTF